MFRLKIVPLLIALLARHGLPIATTGPTPSLSTVTTVEQPPLPTTNHLQPPQRNSGLFDPPAPGLPAEPDGQRAIAARQGPNSAVTSTGADPTEEDPGLGPPLNSEQIVSLSAIESSIDSVVSSQLLALTSLVSCSAVTDVSGSPAGSNCALTGAPRATGTQSKNIGKNINDGWRSWAFVGALPFLLV